MSTIVPIYTAEICKTAYQLNWSLAVFWTANPPPEETWLPALRDACEGHGIRLLEHRVPRARVSQFLVSNCPETAPAAIARGVKGRLQALVRDKVPKAFQRNYGLRSIGSVRSEVVQEYIRKQTTHHLMADRRVQQRFESLAIGGNHGALCRPRINTHAQFCYLNNLAFAEGMRRVYEFGFYVGTFGEYDLGAVWQNQ